MSGLVDVFFGKGGADSASTPDYSRLLDESKKTDEIAAGMGDRQLVVNEQLNKDNQAVSDQATASQLGGMQTAMQAAKDNYQVFNTDGRAVQGAMRDAAMGVINPNEQRVRDEAAGTAVADARRGVTSNANMLFRQGLRYGFSPQKMASMGGDQSAAAGLAEVTAANSARTQAGQQYFDKLGSTYKTYADLNNSIPGQVSAGTQAGTAAVGNKLNTNQFYREGIKLGNDTTLTGRSLYQQGLGSVLNSQTSAYGDGLQANTAARGQNMDVIGTLAGAGAKIKWG